MYDIIFLSETNLGYDVLPSFQSYKKFANPDHQICKFGGIACYVKEGLANHLFQVKYDTSYISFRIDTCPSFMFYGVYIQPEGARYFHESLFTDLANSLMECNEKSFIPVIGGDLNCRPGNFENVSDAKWKYETNKDSTSNKHGKTYLKDLCCTCNINPINGLRYRSKVFSNDFTFFRGNKKSQIDLALTNKKGRKYIEDFTIIQHDWHLSDHKPIMLHLRIPCEINLSGLLARALDLNHVPNDIYNEITQLKGNFNYDQINKDLINSKDELSTLMNTELENYRIDTSLDILELKLKEIHSRNKIKKSTKHSTPDKMHDANKAFDNYMETLNDPNSNEDIVNERFERYMITRSALNKDIIREETNKWNSYLKENDSKNFWAYVDWKGNLGKNKSTVSPTMNEFEIFFQDLYSCADKDEVTEIMNIETNVTIPILDDPITENEINEAFNSMKKSGYDYSISVLRTLVTSFALLLVTLFNLMFFVKYPVTLACSLLSLIPKMGNLKLAKNFRGIQMLKSLACLYDRIIANRLRLWVSYNIDQTAFQKLKSTLLHIFTLRILIEIAKKTKSTIYIATMDIEKAFDHVPRSLLLKKLVSLGVGKCMLFALKQIYGFSVCVIKFQQELSSSFSMKRGVRQGAASSVILFNVFIDGLFQHLQSMCDLETLLNDIHALVHADDTIILSTDRQKFIHKCNEAIRFFSENKLTLNVGKSKYLIINFSNTLHSRSNLILDRGVLKYKESFKYLGVFISDAGSLKQDVNSYIAHKRSNVSIKFPNFCTVHRNAPLSAKLEVLDCCVSSSLTYAAETWGNECKAADLSYKVGIRTALSVRQNTNNEIIFIESDRYPLNFRVKKLQLSFWSYVLKYISDNPDSALCKVVSKADSLNITYIKYYKNLLDTYNDPVNCENRLRLEEKEKWKRKIDAAYIADEDSKLGTYFRINPSLTSFTVFTGTEDERILITRYRTGSHSLTIELGRFSNTPRENRLCTCKRNVQTVFHVFNECPLTAHVVQQRYDNLSEIFNDPDLPRLLLNITKVLKIPTR